MKMYGTWQVPTPTCVVGVDTCQVNYIFICAEIDGIPCLIRDGTYFLGERPAIACTPKPRVLVAQDTPRS